MEAEKRESVGQEKGLQGRETRFSQEMALRCVESSQMVLRVLRVLGGSSTLEKWAAVDGEQSRAVKSIQERASVGGDRTASGSRASQA